MRLEVAGDERTILLLYRYQFLGQKCRKPISESLWKAVHSRKHIWSTVNHSMLVASRVNHQVNDFKELFSLRNHLPEKRATLVNTRRASGCGPYRRTLTLEAGS